MEPRRSRADGDRDITGSSAGQRPRRSGVERGPYSPGGGAGNENSRHPVGPSQLCAVVPPRKNRRRHIVVGEDSGGPRLAVGMADFSLLCFNESKLSAASFALLVSLRSLLPATTSCPGLV